MPTNAVGPHKDHKITWNADAIAAYRILAIRKDSAGNPFFVLGKKPGITYTNEDFFWCEDCEEYVYPDDFVDPAKFGESPYEWQLG